MSVPSAENQRWGRVVCHLGKGLAVEDEAGRIFLCHTRRRLGDVAVGDEVDWQALPQDQGRVERVLPRRSLLVRPAPGGRLRVVAANLDRVYVVVAPLPEPDGLLVDQILAVCEHRGIQGGIVFNKIDLVTESASWEGWIADYLAAGYPVFRVSARSGAGLAEFREALRGHCVMLSGQSGVGKSSLTKALLPKMQLRINELSAKSGLGRHTTTTATLYHLPDGGDLIDSPGVQVFGLAEMSPADLAHAFREFRPFLGQCRFNDCRHVREPGCAVWAAVASGLLSSACYERYRKLLERLQAVPEFAGA